jgi:hypothetical protein
MWNIVRLAAMPGRFNRHDFTILPDVDPDLADFFTPNPIGCCTFHPTPII